MFGITTWIKIAIGIALIAALYGLYYQAQHWCNVACAVQEERAVKVETAYANAVKEHDRKESLLIERNLSLTKQFENALKENAIQTAKAKAAIAERIKANEELRNLKLSAASVQLFNDLARDKSKPADEGTTTAKPGNANSGDTTETVTGQVLFSTIAENSDNHWSCVKKVDAWISFWNAYVANVKASEAPQ